jgi:hypothetical protein
MTNQQDWPDISVLGFDVNHNAQYSGLRDVRPILDRKPYGDWSALFMEAARQCCTSANRKHLGWQGAGFAKCAADDVDLTSSLIRSAIEKTNNEFRSFLSRALINQPDDVASLIVMEGSLAATGGDGYLFFHTL